MGEYKVLLPDGRLQVIHIKIADFLKINCPLTQRIWFVQIVRYTADAKAGFKADVTYEGEQNNVEIGRAHV